MTDRGKTNRNTQTIMSPLRLKSTICRGFVYALILFLTIVLIVAISILSDISQNKDHYVYATVNTDGGGDGGDGGDQVAQTDSEIDSAIQMFFVYQRLLGCRDEYNYNPGAKWSPVETIGVMSDGGTVAIVKDFTKESQHAKLQGICTTELMQEQITALGSDVDLLEKMKEVAGPSGNCEETNSSDSSCYKSISGKQIAGILTEILNQYKEYSYGELTGAEKFKLYLNAFDTCVKSDGDDDKCRGGGVDLNLSVTDANDSNVSEKYWVINGFEYDSETGEVQGKQVYAPRCDTEIYWNGKESDGEIEHFIWPGNQSPQMNGLATAAYGGGHNITCQSIANGVNAYFEDYVIAKAEAGESTSIEDITTSSSSSVDEEDPCEAGFLGFGWIFCPGQNLLTQLIDGLMGIVADSMEWRLLADQAGSNGLSIQDVWMDFLDIANILFAIAFLVMIYSMATSTGLSNYDVKKMLPRLIVVAIAVNISFYICAALVDISNIAGGSMYDLFYGKTTPGVDFGTVLGNAMNSIIGIVAGVLALFIFGGAAAVAVLVVVVCLAFRQIALVILIAISPIAMALYLLPNTERWAKQWFNMFVRLLIIYPAFTAVWGASRLISNIFATTGSSGIPGFIIDLACAIAPAVALPSLFKMSGGIMSFAAGAVAGSAFAKKTSSAVGSVSRNNAITRKATGFAGKRIGNFAQQHTRADSWIGSRLRHYAGAATTHSNGRASNLAYANAFDKQLDDQASLLVSNMDVATRKSVALTGNDGSGQVDWRVRKAAIEQSDDLDSAELEQLIVNTTNTANTLSKNNQNTGAQALRDTVYSKVKDNSAYMGDKEFAVKMRNGTIGSNVQQEYDASVISNASDMSKSTLSKTSADSQSYMYNKLKSVQEAGANIDNAVNALRSTGEQLTNDSKTMSNMSASARNALTGINTLRTETEAKAAEALNLDGIAADLNSTNETIRQQAQSDLARIRSERANPGSDVYRSYNNLSPHDRLGL